MVMIYFWIQLIQTIEQTKPLQPTKKVSRSSKDNQSKYIRASTSEFLSKIGGSLPQGPWTDDENLLVIVVMKLCKRISTDDGDEKVHDLYQKYYKYNESSGPEN